MKVLVVEDDRDIADSIKTNLVEGFHIVDIAHDGADGSFLARNYEYDAVVLDYSLPKKNGLIVCKEIRAAGRSTPILFLSVANEVETKIKAFEQGADDYVTKPFSLGELSARLQALTRRPHQIKSEKLQVDDLILDIEKQTTERNGIPIHLTRKEFNLLKYLMMHPGIIMSRSLIVEYVWSAEDDPLSNSVEAHIRNIRKKITTKRRPNLILNLPGRGYVIDTPDKLKLFK